MTTYSDARKNIRAHFVARWGTRTPVTYDNRGTFFSGSTPVAKPSKAAWARFSMQNNTGRVETIGKSGVVHRRLGLIFVQIFVPEGTGTETMDGPRGRGH